MVVNELCVQGESVSSIVRKVRDPVDSCMAAGAFWGSRRFAPGSYPLPRM